jgi:hypothetical protein
MLREPIAARTGDGKIYQVPHFPQSRLLFTHVPDCKLSYNRLMSNMPTIRPSGNVWQLWVWLCLGALEGRRPSVRSEPSRIAERRSDPH